MSDAGSDFTIEDAEIEDEGPSVESIFQWKKNEAFEPAVQPFTGDNGLTMYFLNQIGDEASLLDIFQYFWDDPLMEEIVNQSNLYVSQIQNLRGKMHNWTELTIDELWQYFALNSLMGIVSKPTIKEYWSTHKLLVTPIFGQTMNRNRFEEITRGLHFANNENPDPTNRFWKLGNICENLLRKYALSVSVGEICCIDESLLKFKGRLSFKQYLPFKRSRFGIKFFWLSR